MGACQFLSLGEAALSAHLSAAFPGFGVPVLGAAAQDVEGSVLGEAVAGHEDTHGFPDEAPRAATD